MLSNNSSGQKVIFDEDGLFGFIRKSIENKTVFVIDKKKREINSLHKVIDNE